MSQAQLSKLYRRLLRSPRYKATPISLHERWFFVLTTRYYSFFG